MADPKIFLEAVKAGELARVQELLAAEPSLANARTETGASALLLSIYFGCASVRDLLLACGAKLDIHEAAAAGRVDRVAALLARDSGLVNAYAPDGFTPLGLAAFFGHPEVVDLLLKHGADVNAVSRNATGYTALTGAVARGDAEIVAALLTHGARTDHRYAQGYTALGEAAASGKTKIVQLLLAHGADVNARTDAAQTPLALAQEKGHREVVALLRQHGAAA
jgi:uncharacterized protein